MRHARLSRPPFLLFGLIGTSLLIRTAAQRTPGKNGREVYRKSEGAGLAGSVPAARNSHSAAPADLFGGNLERTASRSALPPFPILASSAKDGTFVLHDRNAQATFTDRGIILSLIRPGGSQGWGLRWNLADAVANPPQADGPGEARVYSLKGDANENQADLKTFSRIRYPGVRPGIDLVVEPRSQGLEYSFEVAPNADPGSLRLRYEGAVAVRSTGDGGLEIETPLGRIREGNVHCFQTVGGTKREIAAHYVASGTDEYSLALADHDPSLPLTIDPTISWSSFIGGKIVDQNARGLSPQEESEAVAVDASGAVYTAGTTWSSDFPSVGGFKVGPWMGYQAYLTKFDPTGSRVLWSSFIGYESPLGIGVGPDGSIY